MVQQQCDWIPLDFRPLFIPHRVSRVPHLRVRQRFVLLSAPGIVRWFLVSVFSFLLFFSFASRKRTSRVSDQSYWQLKCIEPPMGTARNQYTYLTKDHPRVEGLCRRIVNNVPSSKSVVHLHNASASRSPVVSNLPDAFQGPSLELIA